VMLARDLLGDGKMLDDTTIAQIRSQELWDQYPSLRGCFRVLPWDEFAPVPRWSWAAPR
jgi:hypothetical protein